MPPRWKGLEPVKLRVVHLDVALICKQSQHFDPTFPSSLDCNHSKGLRELKKHGEGTKQFFGPKRTKLTQNTGTIFDEKLKEKIINLQTEILKNEIKITKI